MSLDRVEQGFIAEREIVQAKLGVRRSLFT